MATKEQALTNVHKAINDLFGIRPSLSTNEARAVAASSSSRTSTSCWQMVRS